MVLPPKPPPISAGMARMSLCGMPVRCAVIARTMNWPWLELQIVVLPSGADRDQAGMRLDIALVNGARGEGALDDDVGLLEAFGDVALLVLEAAGDVGRLAVELVELVQDQPRRA